MAAQRVELTALGALGAQRDGEAAESPGAAALAPATELSVVRAAGVDFSVDSGDNRVLIVERSADTIGHC